VPQGEIVVPALLHAAVWLLMVAAMMLPTTLPLLEMFRRVTAARPERGRLTALVVLGFFVAWFAFGIVAHAADAALQLTAARSSWFVANGWTVGRWCWRRRAVPVERPQVPLPRRVPDAVRVRGRAGRGAARREAWRSVDHGLFCVGCC
jgi:predicted metal-binding membrane protein